MPKYFKLPDVYEQKIFVSHEVKNNQLHKITNIVNHKVPDGEYNIENTYDELIGARVEYDTIIIKTILKKNDYSHLYIFNSMEEYLLSDRNNKNEQSYIDLRNKIIKHLTPVTKKQNIFQRMVKKIKK